MLKIRLRRMGNRNRPFYRVVVLDSRKAPTSRAIEEIGHYDPRAVEGGVQIDAERVRYWTDTGAQLSPAVARIMGRGAGEPDAAERAPKPEPAAEVAAEPEAAAEPESAEPESAEAETDEETPEAAPEASAA